MMSLYLSPISNSQVAEAAKVIAADSAEAERAVLAEAMKAAGVVQPQRQGAGAVQPPQEPAVHVPDEEELQAAAVAELAGATSGYINMLAQVGRSNINHETATLTHTP